MKLLLVFNPKAASGRARALQPKIEARLRKFSELHVHTTRHAGDARDWLADTALADFDGVVIAGGDGTLFEVLNGLYQQSRDQRVPLGLIPIGTGNAFSRELGLSPGDWESGVELIQKRNVITIDVGRVQTAAETFHFLNIIGMGFPVDAMITAARLKKMGRSAYTLAVIREMLRLKSYPLQIEIDGTLIKQNNVFVEISNTRYTGASFLMAPAARFDDGLLDVTLLQNLPRRRLLRLFPTIYRGHHVAFDEVTVIKASVIKIMEPENRQLVPDGEFFGQTPATITCLKRDLQIFAPNIREQTTQ